MANALQLLAAAGCLALCAAAGAAQKPPAERAGMDPASRNKVTSVLARSQIEEPAARATVQRQRVTTPGGQGGCVTNIGTPPVTSGTERIGNRFGAGNNDQVIVVKGPVVNVCK